MSAPAAVWQDWTEKHRPRSLAEIVGNGPAVKEMLEWANAWKDGEPKEKALVLAGEPGVGKTSAAHALARDLGWGVIEMNASDQRNEEIIRKIAGAGARNRAFSADGSFQGASAGRQVVILDEADNLFGREDRGGMKAILDTIREAKQPIILIANDLYELQRRSASLKTLARTVKFSKVRVNSIPPALRRICEKEGIRLELGVDEAIAERAGGDLRSAVNDLQALCLGRTEVTLADVEALGRRDTTGDVWELMGKVFYGRDANEARKAAWDLDETPEDIALWIDENLPVMYTDKADLVDGYAALSKASTFLGRVTRRQQYGLWSYATELMTSGVAVAKHDKPAGARFQFPSWLRKQSSSKAVRELRNRTAGKVGAVLHTSNARTRNDIFPYLKQLMQDEKVAAYCAWRFEIDADELAFLLDDKSTSPRVKKLLEDAAKTYEVPARELSGVKTGFGRYSDTEPSDEEGAEDEAPAATAKHAADADDDEEEAPAKPAPAPVAKTAPAAAKADAKADPKASPAPEKKKQKSLGDF